jgi:hypothetical protein
MRFRLKVIDGQPRAAFPGEEPRRAELLSRLLAPDPYHVTILLWEILRVEKGHADGWSINVSGLRITCTPEAITIEEGAHESDASDARDQPALVELTLGEAEGLFSRWRHRYVGWEFRRAYMRGREAAKTEAEISRAGGGAERPVLFRVSDRSGRYLSLARDLAGAVRIAGTRLRRGERHSTFSISAVYADGSEEALPPARYCRRKAATPEDAARYITRRDEGMRMAKGLGLSDSQIEMLLGDQVGRCDPDDPEEKQVEDYVRNAPEEWLTDEELKAEGEKIFRAVKPRKAKRGACFVFST